MARKHKQKSDVSFPPEIIREILLKASVKPLLRCKSVCKEWYSLISDQNFVKTHYTLSSTNINYKHHRLIYYIYKQENDFISCPLYNVLSDKSANNALLLENPLQRPWSRGYRGFKIVRSCNGLVCILVDDNTLFIYNPSTRTTNILPGSKQGDGLYGFAYDETTHDYKVVKIWCCTWPYLGIMIYSLKAGSWKEIGRCANCAYHSNDVKFLNGAFHWVVSVNWPDPWHIVSLDLGKETYGEVLQPEYAEGDKKLSLGVLGEWLCVLCFYFKSRVVDVWVMKVYGDKESWTKLACIPRPTISTGLYLDPLCISKYGKVLLRFGPQLLVYDLKDSSSTMIDNFNGCREACVVVESLVSPFPPLALADNNEN